MLSKDLDTEMQTPGTVQTNTQRSKQDPKVLKIGSGGKHRGLERTLSASAYPDNVESWMEELTNQE